MKIVDRKTFLELPPGTVYAKYQPHMYDEMAIKEDTIKLDDGTPIDWIYQSIIPSFRNSNGSDDFDLVGPMVDGGQSAELDYHCCGRDGCFEDEQLFAIWEREDHAALISRLTAALRGPITDTEDPLHWSHGGSDYDGTTCKGCGRLRVLLYANGRRICEKCNWDQHFDDYASDHTRVG